MSVNKFKVGDKVRVRKGLVVGKYYGNVYCFDTMARMGGQMLTISDICCNYYKDDVCGLYWSDKMLEPVGKTLDNLCVGDFVECSDGVRKVLVIVDDYYLLGSVRGGVILASWHTANDLKQYGYVPVEPTIEIDGKNYKKADVEEAIKDLEVVE
jgi:hypothetical protein